MSSFQKQSAIVSVEPKMQTLQHPIFYFQDGISESCTETMKRSLLIMFQPQQFWSTNSTVAVWWNLSMKPNQFEPSMPEGHYLELQGNSNMMLLCSLHKNKKSWNQFSKCSVTNIQHLRCVKNKPPKPFSKFSMFSMVQRTFLLFVAIGFWPLKKLVMHLRWGMGLCLHIMLMGQLPRRHSFRQKKAGITTGGLNKKH